MAHDDTWMEEVEPTDRRGRTRAIVAGAFVVVVIAALYSAAALYFGDRVPADTRIGGVSIGGMTESDARETLEEELAEEAAEPVTFTVEGEKYTIDPEEAGLAYDYEGSLEGLTGFSFNPVDLWGQATGGIEREIMTEVDEDELADAVDEATEGLDREPVEGKVSLDGASVKQTKAEAGLSVEREQLAETIRNEWPRTQDFGAAPTSKPTPQISQDTIDAFVEDDLEPLVAGPVEVTSTDPTAKGSDDREISFEITAEQLAGAVSVTSEQGRFTTSVDDKKLARAASSAAKSSGSFREPKDATVVHRGGDDFEVTSSSTGVALDEKGIGAKVADAMTKKGDKRTISVKSTEEKPDFTTRQAKQTLPKEELSTFTTNLPSTTGARTENIKLAARTLDGAYVAPGDTFSLNERLGERTAGKGYQEAGVISGNRLTDDYGGGISQLSTTLFNAVFFSGAKIEEFHPHSFYIDRYPEGREATISYPNVDNRFTNDTDAGILIQASVSGDEVTVTFRGRKKYDEIKASKSDRRGVTQPSTIRDDDEDCVPQSPAPGFSVDITRTFVKDGRTVNTSRFTTTYKPQDDVTCTG